VIVAAGLLGRGLAQEPEDVPVRSSARGGEDTPPSLAAKR
jgi:hypothetical protein